MVTLVRALRATDKNIRLLISLQFLVVVLDVTTKYAMELAFSPGEGHFLFYRSGWGLGAGWVIHYVSWNGFVALLVLSVLWLGEWYLFTGKQGAKLSFGMKLGSAFVLSGAVANAIDALQNGGVIDWILLATPYHNEAINVADVALIGGTTVVLVEVARKFRSAF